MKILGRLLLAAVSAFVFLAVISITSRYFGITSSEENQATHALIIFAPTLIIVATFGKRAAIVAIITFPILMICSAFAVMWREINDFANAPDLNGDGLFTIRDLTREIALVSTAPGNLWLDLIVKNNPNFFRIVAFLELPQYIFLWTARFFLTLLYWSVSLTGYSLLADALRFKRDIAG